ncbi:MAG: DUF2202 domain-containing protein [Xanthomonadales bacterium]|nr:DUF2202 domain-containing protein [Xanthomonadales bacterium]
MKRILIALLATLITPFVLAAGPQGGPPGGTLSDAEADTLAFMREEEKLARDVYLVLLDEWGDFVFANIAHSESRHMATMLTQLDRYRLDDPVPSDAIGDFSDPALTALFLEQTARGRASREEAFHVGAYVEELDIRDLRIAIAGTDETPLVKAYENLLIGAHNHLRAFVANIEALGTEYRAQVLDQADVDSILGVGGPPSGQGFQINPGLTDAWFDPNTKGQGFFISVYGDLQMVFLAWFTFDTERPPEDVSADLGDPGHRWLTAQGPYFGAQAELEVTLTAGGVFESPTPGAVNELYGSIVLQFENCNAGTVIFDLPDIGRVGAIPIQRIAPDHAAHCQQLNEASR